MRSCSSSSSILRLQSKKRILFTGTRSIHHARFFSTCYGVRRLLKSLESTSIEKRLFSLGRNALHGVRPRCMDEDSMDVSSLVDDSGSDEEPPAISSSEGEDSDSEILLTPIDDCEMPTVNKQFISSDDDALTVTAYRLAMLGKRHGKKYKIGFGFFANLGLAIFLVLLLALVDWCAWRIVRLPLDPLYVTRPFLVSAVLVATVGYILVPLLRKFNVVHKEVARTAKHHSPGGTPTMGGLYFVPIGAVVAKVLAGPSRAEVSGAIAVTLAFAVLGLLDDTLCLIKNNNSGSSGKTKLMLEVVVAAWFSFWLETADITSPYCMKMLIPVPAPFGLLNIGRCYLFLSTFSLVCVTYGTTLVDELDGMASGVAALAFVGLSIAVLPICADLSVFGASMAGACVGFLMHNRYKASIHMGSTGSLALGGALAAMASCTGMFLPLFIACGIFMLEVLYLIMQVFCFNITKRLNGDGRTRWLFQAERLHNRLEACGVKAPYIIAGSYVVSSVLALLAGYVGLISA